MRGEIKTSFIYRTEPSFSCQWTNKQTNKPKQNKPPKIVKCSSFENYKLCCDWQQGSTGLAAVIYTLKKAAGMAASRATAILTAKIPALPSQHTTDTPGPTASITFPCSILGFSSWRPAAWLHVAWRGWMLDILGSSKWLNWPWPWPSTSHGVGVRCERRR